MRNHLLAAAALGALCAADVGGALAQFSTDGVNRYLDVKNYSGLKATSVYIMPSEGDDCCWSRDLLEGLEIAPGKATTPGKQRSPEIQPVNFDDGSGNCVFNIRITAQFPGWEWLFRHVNVCPTPQRITKSREKDALEANPQEAPETDWIYPIIAIKLAGEPKSKDKKDRRMTVQNRSDLTVREIYIYAHERTVKQSSKNEKKPKDCCWSRNLLQKVIPKYTRLTVDFDDGSNECRFDIAVVGSKGTGWHDWYVHNVDVCLSGVLTLGTGPVVIIKNESSQDVLEVFAKPSGTGSDKSWSHDLLGWDIIAKGNSRTVDIDVGDSLEACKFDIRVTKFARDSKPWCHQVDACGTPPKEITLKDDAPGGEC